MIQVSRRDGRQGIFHASVRAAIALALTAGYWGPWFSLAAAAARPEAGLVLWLRADRGVDVSGGRIVQWRDQSSAGHLAVVPAGFVGPTLDAQARAVVFSAGTALRISGQVLPKDARQMTILGVARADSPSSIGLFSIRNAARPLVQLDVDEHARARFIVRDGQSRTSK